MRNFKSVFSSAGLLLAACTALLAQSPTPAPTEGGDRYRIGFQDVLEVQVYLHPELTQRVNVGPGGSIYLNRLAKPIAAVCKTERELALDLEAAYKETKIRDPRVTVLVSEQKSQSVAVIGAVEKPGNYYINRRVHLLEILALAGGPNKESGTRMLIARAGSTSNCKENTDNAANSDQIAVIDYKIRDVQEGRETMWMQPGDVVSVLDADVVYVYGNVKKVGAYKTRDPITLTQAIVMAEGPLPTAKKDAVRVLRQVSGSAERKEMVYDLNAIDKSKVKDPFLEPGDIVAVSEDPMKKVLQGVAGIFKSAIPNAVYRLP